MALSLFPTPRINLRFTLMTLSLFRSNSNSMDFTSFPFRVPLARFLQSLRTHCPYNHLLIIHFVLIPSSFSYNGELSFVAEDGGDTIPTNMFGPINLSNTPTLFLSTLFYSKNIQKKYSIFEFSTFNLPPRPPSKLIPTTHDPYTRLLVFVQWGVVIRSRGRWQHHPDRHVRSDQPFEHPNVVSFHSLFTRKIFKKVLRIRIFDVQSSSSSPIEIDPHDS